MSLSVLWTFKTAPLSLMRKLRVSLTASGGKFWLLIGRNIKLSWPRSQRAKLLMPRAWKQILLQSRRKRRNSIYPLEVLVHWSESKQAMERVCQESKLHHRPRRLYKSFMRRWEKVENKWSLRMRNLFKRLNHNNRLRKLKRKRKRTLKFLLLMFKNLLKRSL